MELREAGNNLQLFPLLVFVNWLLNCSIFISFVDKIHYLISRSLSLLHLQPNCGDHDDTRFLLRSNSESESIQPKVCENEDGRLSRDDVETVMGNLGFLCSSQEGERSREYIVHDELTAMFDENEPSLEELKETFNVFDENRDGFIDAEELQRVLGLLGLKEGRDLQDCKRMIRTFDQNQDGKIDFNEFVKFMEIAFC